MDPWVWLVGYLVAFVLLQLLLIRYVLDGGSTGDGSRERPAPGMGRRTASTPETSREPTEEGMVTCQHCGTPNRSEPSYSFCRACANPLR